MSYILDALNRSEKERASKRLQQSPQDGKTSTGSGWHWWHTLLVLAVIVAVNLAAFYLWSGPPGAAPDESADAPMTRDQPAVKKPIVAISKPAPERPPASTSIRPTVNLAELPLAIRRVLPDVEITSHIYSSDPSLRMVKIDGVSRHEGDLLSESHRLIGITDSGVILDFQGYRYRLDVVEDWQQLD